MAGAQATTGFLAERKTTKKYEKRGGYEALLLLSSMAGAQATTGFLAERKTTKEYEKRGGYEALLLLSSSFAITTKFSYQTKYTVELNVQIPTTFDTSTAPGAKGYVHIRIQQRNGRKSLTTVQGLKKELNYGKILEYLKKEIRCDGNVVRDKELGKVIQLQGDQRKNVSHFLVKGGIVKKDRIKLHGF